MPSSDELASFLDAASGLDAEISRAVLWDTVPLMSASQLTVEERAESLVAAGKLQVYPGWTALLERLRDLFDAKIGVTETGRYQQPAWGMLWNNIARLELPNIRAAPGFIVFRGQRFVAYSSPELTDLMVAARLLPGPPLVITGTELEWK